MPTSQEARALAPRNMPTEDVQNYQGFFGELVSTGQLPVQSKIYNIHQVFDDTWEYQGAWMTIATETRPTDLFWVWIDSEWENMRIVEETPVPMYTWISFLTGLKILHYRTYGNCGDWMLLSAGTTDISRFC